MIHLKSKYVYFIHLRPQSGLIPGLVLIVGEIADLQGANPPPPPQFWHSFKHFGTLVSALVRRPRFIVMLQLNYLNEVCSRSYLGSNSVHVLVEN